MLSHIAFNGSHMEIPHEPEEVVAHHPDKCKSCPHLSDCLQQKGRFECGESRYVVDLKVSTVVTKHQSMNACGCPLGDSNLKGHFPEGVKAHVQYGDSVSVLVGLLR